LKSLFDYGNIYVGDKKHQERRKRPMTEKTFKSYLKKVMEHNDYTSDMTTVDVCNEKDKWTPCDLILREYYNNGGGSAKGFLGITTKA
jgi:hypothetical protein